MSDDIEKKRKYWRDWYYRKMDQDPEWRKAESERNSVKRKVKRDWLVGLKKSMKCARCDFSDFRALCFHHSDPSQKKGEIANMIKENYGKERILEEMAKCEVLCQNCHHIEHYEQRTQSKVA